MSLVSESVARPYPPSRPFSLFIGRSIHVVGSLIDALVIIGLSVLAGIAYHLVVYDEPGRIATYTKVGSVIAIIHLVLQLQRQLTGHPQQWPSESLRNQFFIWNVSFLCLLVLGFIGKISGNYSRGAILLYYVCGLPLLMAWRSLWMELLQRALNHRWIVLRRGLVLGTLPRISEFMQKHVPWQHGLTITHSLMIPDDALEPTPAGDAALKSALDETVELVRGAELDDVIVLLPWSSTRALDTCTEALMTVPAFVHLGSEPILDRFADVRLSRLGSATMLNLVRPPLTRFEVMAKRAFDLVFGSMALLVAAPLILTVVLLIKLDSPGPVFFWQRRHGFNQKPFRILKFRTMTVAEDGEVVTQATSHDPRVTRVGRYLRRYNIDELPQLVNVIKGDMSLVGPRPHALTHNHQFEQKIARYARRHNIKPGMTGWAQIHGLRGRTDTVAKMQARVEHDLYYIDNWSLLFDLYILILTVTSPKAFRNAE